MEYMDCIDRLRERDARLAAELAAFHNLENVLGWMKERSIPLAALDLVTRTNSPMTF